MPAKLTRLSRFEQSAMQAFPHGIGLSVRSLIQPDLSKALAQPT
jgi:hypothetical protein